MELSSHKLTNRVYTYFLLKNPSFFTHILYYRYFKDLLIEFDNKMSTYKKSIESIESYINSNTNTKNSYSPEVLQDVMKHQMELFISLASQVGQIHERIEDLKHRFRAIEL